MLNDGKVDVTDNGGRWLSSSDLPHAVELEWKEPVTLGAARIISEYYDGKVFAPIADFVLQWHDGTQWKDIPDAAASGNCDPYWNRTFQPLKTAKMRLWITKTRIDVSRIWEVELYGAVTDPRPSRLGEQATFLSPGAICDLNFHGGNRHDGPQPVGLLIRITGCCAFHHRSLRSIQ